VRGAGRAAPAPPLLPAARPAPARADAPLDATDAALATRLDALVRAALAGADKPVAGVAVYVARHGAKVLEAGYGFADAGARVAMPSDDAFRIGSITKVFTAVPEMRLRIHFRRQAGKVTGAIIHQGGQEFEAERVP
jgi:CubicO group peptidase (beta-lactamase class C family)